MHKLLLFNPKKALRFGADTTSADPTIMPSSWSVTEFISSVSGIYLCYGLAKLGLQYVDFLRNPLRDKGLGPSGGSFLSGQFWTIRKEPFMVPHQRWIETIASWDAPFLFYTLLWGKSCIIILDKDIVKTVLTAPYSKYPLRFVKEIQFLQNTIGDGLVTLQGVDWMRHRSIIQPAFLAQSLKHMLTDLVPQMTSRLVTSWKLSQGREIDLSSHLSALTLEIIGVAAFSHDIGALDKVQEWAELSVDGEDQDRPKQLEEINDPFIKAFGESFTPTLIGTIAFVLGMPFLSRWFNPKTRRVRKAMNTGVDAIIQEAKDNQSSTAASSLRKSTTTVRRSRKSLLEILLEAHDGEAKNTLNDVELRDEIKTFLFAGHETTSTYCYQALWSLCSYPDIQEKVFQDIVSHCPNNGDLLDLETVERMEYFNAFMQEVLRMFPPIGMITRATTEDVETFGTQYRVPKDTRITIPIFLLHRHPKYWKDPDSFQPERWIFQDEKDREAFMSQIRFAFLPFSLGARNCVGQRFAVIEAHMIMAELIRSFAFKIAPSQQDTKFTLSNMLALKTKPRLKVVVKARK